jgi:hypothetical protein
MRMTLAVGFFILLTACSSITPTPPQATSPIVGRWTTGGQMSQIGPSVTKLSLNADGTFVLCFRSFLLWGSDRGKYRVEGNRLFLDGKKCACVDTFTLDGDTLVVVEESGDTFRYHRVK